MITHDDKDRSIAVAELYIALKKAGVSFGILGEKESCCGESIRKVGGEEGGEEGVRQVGSQAGQSVGADIVSFNGAGGLEGLGQQRFGQTPR